jgi:hypothetical protein
MNQNHHEIKQVRKENKNPTDVNLGAGGAIE